MERYSEYKDSGVKWLGEIPGHWKTLPGLAVFSENKSKNTTLSYNTVLSLSYGNIIVKKDINEGLVPAEYNTYQIVHPGYIIIRCTDLQNDKVSLRTGLVKHDGIITNAYLGLVVNKEYNPSYVHYFLHAWDVTKEIYRHGSGLRQSLSWLDLRRLPILLPSINEQEAIANYLDSATSKIDSAIAQQQKMIDLLNERKHIIINNAVTKGLDPNVKMKPSGIDWIGDIPEHWEVSRIKNVIKLLTDYDANGSFSDIASNCNINSGKPYAWMVRTTDLVNNRVGLVDGNNYCDLKTYNYLAKSSLCSGDLLMTKRGNVGTVYLVPECDVPMTLAPNLYLLKTKDLVDNRYLMYYLSSSKPQGQLALLNKSTTLGALYKDDVKALQIVLPSKKEQIEIAKYIDSKCADIEGVMELTKRKISLLQERKQIIINDVVTGKVKVV